MIHPTLSSLALIASSFITVANSLLIPPKATLEDLKFWDESARLKHAGLKLNTLLNCSSCPLAIGTNANGQPARWAQGDDDTMLVMEFSVRGHQLLLNGDAFYPITPDTIRKPLSAKQVYANDDGHSARELFDGKLPLSTSIAIDPMAKDAWFPGTGAFSRASTMRRVSVEVIGLVDRVVKVDTLVVSFSDNNGELKLHDLSNTPYSKHSTSASDSCTTVSCRAQNILATKIAAFRDLAASKLHQIKKFCVHKFGIGRSHRHQVVEGQKSGLKLHGGVDKFKGKFDKDGKFHGFRHVQKHHRKCPGASHILHLVVGFVKHIVLPIFIGISAGMAASGIGMVVGQLVVFFWTRYRRGSQAYQIVDQEDATAVDETLKKNVGGPPEYEDVYPQPTEDVFDEKN